MRRWIFFILGLAGMTTAWTQSDVRFEEAYSINPLSHNGVTCIHQDRLGFLWIGTFNGLNKYDGYSFRIYRFNENISNQVSTNRVNSIYEDRQGILWIITYDGAVHRFNPETEVFRDFSLSGDSQGNIRFRGIYESPSGLMALYSENRGVIFVKSNDSDQGVVTYPYLAEGDPGSDLPEQNINFVTRDTNKDFWIGTEAGLYRISEDDLGKTGPVRVNAVEDPDIPGDPEFRTVAIHDERIWFGTSGSGLFVYDPSERSLSGFTPVNESLGSSRINITVLESNGKTLWIGTDEKKLVSFDSQTEEIRVHEMRDPRSGKWIKQIYIDNFSQVWLITEEFGITRFDPVTGKFRHYNLNPPELSTLTDDERLKILEDSNNRFWIGGQNMGVQHYNRNTDSFKKYINDPRDPFSLQSNVVECLAEDREGNIWVGTNWFGKGLSRLIMTDPAFEYIRPVKYPKNQIENIIRSIYVDSKGYTWTGTKHGKIFIYDPDLKLHHVIEESSKANYSGYSAYSIYEDGEGYIWLCTKGAGIYKSLTRVKSPSFSYRNISFSSYHHNPADENSLSNDNVYDMLVDDLGRAWIATYGGGLNMMEQDGSGVKFHHYTTENSALTSDKVRDLFLDSKGRLWLATTYGLNYIDIYNGSHDSFSFGKVLSDPGGGKGLTYNDIIMIIEDRNAHIWLATAGGGVNEIQNPSGEPFDIRYYNSAGGLKDDYILSITEDIYGFIWIGTNSGLSRYNPVNGEINNFNNQIGQPDNFLSERTATNSKGEKVLFGTINGFFAINADQIRETSIRPVISLTGFQLNNSEVTPGDKDSPLDKTIPYCGHIVLKPDQTNFSIEFSMLSFASPRSNHYAYMLERFANNWSYIGTEHKATFTNIPPGEYVFRVKGLNSDLTEYGTEASLDITILPPVWKTGIAYVIYLAVLFGLVLLGIRLSMRFIRLKNEVKIEKRVAESKIRFFTNISHEIRTPLTLIIGPLEKLISEGNVRAEINQQLAVIHRNTKRLYRMVNQILDFRKVQNEQMILKIQEIEVIPFLRQIYESFENLAKQKNIRFKLIYDPNYEKIPVWGDIQKLDIVFFNLLSNAFKFTPENGQISLIVSYAGDQRGSVKIVVKDSGIGIEKDKLDLIFDRFFVSHTAENNEYQGTGIGLSLSLEYIKLHKGEIKASSTPDTGTEFTVILPTGKKHFPENVVLRQRDAFSYTPKIRNVEGMEEVEEIEKIPESGNVDAAGRNDLYHILVVEDDIELGNYLRFTLEPMYRVDVAKNGKDGWEMAKELIPDLIITDIMMPEMNGIELTRLIKDDFSTCHIPVVILSSRSEVENQVEGLQTGAEAYLAKPFNMDLLLSQVQSFINQREKIKEIFNNRVELKPDEVQVTSRDKEFIDNVIKLIDKNMSDPEFNVEKLAARVFISRTLFYKKIKGITGYQPVELIRMMRLKKAAQYIETGEFNISEVAYMVGYNDIRYFSTSFKKQFGVSPSQYQVS